jgi:hypothetical protein
MTLSGSLGSNDGVERVVAGWIDDAPWRPHCRRSRGIRPQQMRADLTPVMSGKFAKRYESFLEHQKKTMSAPDRVDVGQHVVRPLSGTRSGDATVHILF